MEERNCRRRVEGRNDDGRLGNGKNMWIKVERERERYTGREGGR